MNTQPIGIFDSGIGGLLVAKEIAKILPHENLLYLGDTARVPYGNRGKDIITQFSLELASFLLEKKVKCLVIACNTITLTCLPQIQAISPVPVIGVISPSIDHIAKTTKNKKVGVLGTKVTIQSGTYRNELKRLDSGIKVFSKACPLFVPMAEEGLIDTKLATIVANEYLSHFEGTGIDTLHLGCTHYPLFKDVLQELVGDTVTITDSGVSTALALRKVLVENDLLNTSGIKGKKTLYVTDHPDNIYALAERLFGEDLSRSIKAVAFETGENLS